MKIAKIYDFDIKISWSTFLIVGLVGFYAASFYGSIVLGASIIDLIVVGLINGLVILGSILGHEIAHSIVAQKYGLKVTEIELYVFGGASKIEEDPKTPKSEIVITVVGPLTSLLIGGVFLLIYFGIPFLLPPIVAVTLFYSGITNIGLGLFNLLPAFPVDGGRILRAYLWYRRKDIISATKTASRIGSYFAYGLMGYGLFQMFLFGFFSGLWLIIIGWFLNSQTKQAYNQTVNELTLAKLKVKDMINMPRLEIPFNLTVEDALKHYFMLYKKDFFPVVRNGQIEGVLHINDINNIPIRRRKDLIVGYAMRSIKDFPSISDKDTGREALKNLAKNKTRPNLVVVKDYSDDYVLGFIGEGELVSSLRMCQLYPEKC
ncbi:MAG: site-2 protease family protein [Candidatus Lokiarchaeota archaeon]|jgi:Zn-dependent protease